MHSGGNMRREIVRMDNVTLETDGITFLDNIHFHIFKGEVMGLIALNSQGEKQLMELICQNVPIRYGRIYFDGKMVNSYAHSAMGMNEVSIIGESSKLVGNLSVSDNIFVVRRGFRKLFINSRILDQQVKGLLKEINLTMDERQPASRLRPLERCAVELLRAVTAGSKLIIISNINNLLSSSELGKFHEIIRYYSGRGLSFLYADTHYEALFSVCDRAMVLESGRIRRILDEKNMTPDKIKPYLLPIDAKPEKIVKLDGRFCLEFRNVYSKKLKGLTFSVKRGECIVLLDTDNSATEDIISLIYGQQQLTAGDIFYGKERFDKRTASDILNNGIAVIPANPISEAVYENLTYLENVCLFMDKRIKRGVSRKKLLKSVILEYGDQIGPEIYTRNVTKLDKLSLYNMIYYRYYVFRPELVFCVQPLAQADLCLRRHILGLIRKFKEQKITVVILTASISEHMDIANRMLVLKEGQVLKEYDGDSL